MKPWGLFKYFREWRKKRVRVSPAYQVSYGQVSQGGKTAEAVPVYGISFGRVDELEVGEIGEIACG